MKAYHQDICAKLIADLRKSVTVSFDTAFTMCQIGLLKDGFGTNDSVQLTHVFLTDHGVDVGMARAKLLLVRRNVRNHAAQARSDAMRSVGMKRTKYGWE